MSTLPNRIQQILIESFAQVPQRILWKYDGEIKNLSDNVMTRKWFPQRDVLRESPLYFIFYNLYNLTKLFNF
jgi:glucuronosyltransferase